jgi:hypothetical protein
LIYLPVGLSRVIFRSQDVDMSPGTKEMVRDGERMEDERELLRFPWWG